MNITKVIFDTASEFLDMPYEEQRFAFYSDEYHRYARQTIQFTENDDYIIVSHTESRVRPSHGRFYLKVDVVHKFGVNKKTKKSFGNNWGSLSNLLSELNIPKYEWFVKAINNKVDASFVTKTIARDVLLGKITNPEDLVKKYMKLCHYKNIGWKVFNKYFKNYHLSISPAVIIEAFDNPELFMRRVLDCEKVRKTRRRRDGSLQYETTVEAADFDFKDTVEFYDNLCIIRDITYQALAFGVKLNAKWSVKRFTAEHNKLTQMAMAKKLSQKSCEDIYDMSKLPEIPSKYNLKFLNNERDIFEEGSSMHHCLYTSYYGRIKDNEYLAFAFNAPERFTLGLRYDYLMNKYVYDQAYLKYDKQISDESHMMINEFLDDVNVQKFLDSLVDEKKKIADKDVSITDTGLRGLTLETLAEAGVPF